MGIISSIYCDIGDEQSIEQNLHLQRPRKNIITILESSDRSSLILLTSSGPARTHRRGLPRHAILDALTRQGFTLATTHHNR